MANDKPNGLKDFRFLNPMLDFVGLQWVERRSISFLRLASLMIAWFLIWLIPIWFHGIPVHFSILESLLLAMAVTWLGSQVGREWRDGSHMRSTLLTESPPARSPQPNRCRAIASIHEDLERMSRRHSDLQSRDHG